MVKKIVYADMQTWGLVILNSNFWKVKQAASMELALKPYNDM